MKNGYDQFFKAAQKVKGTNKAQKISLRPERNLSLSKQKNRKRKAFPVGPAIYCTVMLVGAVLAYQNLDKIENVLNKIEVSALGTAGAEEAKTPAKKSLPEGEKAAENSADPKSTKEVKLSWSAEEIALFSKLQERKEQLDHREEELNQLAAELQKQKLELEKKIDVLESTRAKISKTLEQRVEVDTEKVNKLVAMYSDMKPQSSAKIFETIDMDLGIEILSRMSKKNAAAILNLLPAERAKLFSEKYTGYSVGQK